MSHVARSFFVRSTGATFCALLVLGLDTVEAYGRAAPQAAAWKRVDQQRATGRIDRVHERGSGWLLIRDGVVVRRRLGREQPLTCTDPLGSGRARAMGADPAGLTFVATDRGLWVTSAEVDVLHRVELPPEAPQGPLTSVLVDDVRRVWIATAAGFGCIDPSFYHGHAIAVPAPGPYRVLAVDGSSVLLDTSDGRWRYRLDHAPAPSIEQVRVDGKPAHVGDEVVLERAASIRLTATVGAAGEAASGAVLRYRFDGHHVWRSLADGHVPAPEPGQHWLELVAEDRELRRSTPFALRVRVRYPVLYRAGVFGAALGLLAAAVLACAFRAQRHGQPVTLRWRRALLSTVLLLVLGLQAVAGLVPHARGWPFVGYSMYTSSFEPGYVTYQGVLVAFDDQGEQGRCHPAALGVAHDSPWQVLGALLRGGRAAHLQTLERLAPMWRGAGTIERLQVRVRRTVLGPRGPIRVAPLILSDHRRKEQR